ncbi:holo-ACP synthase [Coprothermobacter proteolyticus]|uniref:holo-ACP synthase n=1 Tax=Coprothermobacter proteolyticus TaxID=35786 RepID=UPI000A868787|nr:holo-ACP synthase [Coprothermobacter proteolyticus]
MMAIRGVGIDIVSMSRFEKVYAKHGQRFIAGFFAEEEQSMPLASLAARFAAKEAVKKALNTPSILFKHIVIGSPAREAKIVGQEIQGRVWVSISHEKDNAVAIAIWEAD